jgi:hypothetical protein
MALTILPNAGQTLGQTRDPIRINFSNIENAFVVDHVDYAITGAGKHNKITFPVQGSAPSFASGEIGLFNLAVSGTNELNITNSAGVTTPFTRSLSANPGWTYLPSGMIMAWGTGTINGTVTIAYNTVPNLPVFTVFTSTPMLVRIVSSSVANTLAIQVGYSLTQFTVISSGGGSQTFAWSVIGK